MSTFLLSEAYQSVLNENSRLKNDIIQEIDFLKRESESLWKRLYEIQNALTSVAQALNLTNFEDSVNGDDVKTNEVHDKDDDESDSTVVDLKSLFTDIAKTRSESYLREALLPLISDPRSSIERIRDGVFFKCLWVNF